MNKYLIIFIYPKLIILKNKFADGGVLIGSSEHVHRYLNGQACVYKSVSEAYLQHKNYNRKRISLDSGTNDGCFIVTSEKVPWLHIIKIKMIEH